MTGIIIACAVSFVLGLLSLAVLGGLLLSRRKSKRGRGGTRASKPQAESKPERAAPRKGIMERVGVMNLILVLVGVALLVFTIAMIDLFKTQYAIPDTLVTCVFATLGGECGILGWIKTNKDKHQQRRWDKEDREEPIRPPPSGADDDQPKG